MLQDTLPSVKWVDPVKILTTELHTASMDFLKQNFHTVLQSPKYVKFRIFKLILTIFYIIIMKTFPNTGSSHYKVEMYGISAELKHFY